MFEELVLDADAAIDWVLRGWERFAGAQTSTERLILLRYGPPQPFGYGLQFQRWKWAELSAPRERDRVPPRRRNGDAVPVKAARRGRRRSFLSAGGALRDSSSSSIPVRARPPGSEMPAAPGSAVASSERPHLPGCACMRGSAAGNRHPDAPPVRPGRCARTASRRTGILPGPEAAAVHRRDGQNRIPVRLHRRGTRPAEKSP